MDPSIRDKTIFFSFLRLSSSPPLEMINDFYIYQSTVRGTFHHPTPLTRQVLLVRVIITVLLTRFAYNKQVSMSRVRYDLPCEILTIARGPHTIRHYTKSDFFLFFNVTRNQRFAARSDI